MNYQVGDVIQLNLWTITPVYAKVVEVGNTYVVIEINGRRRRVSSRDYHMTFVRNLEDA